MTSASRASPASRPAETPLTEVLGQTEHVKDLVEECAEELSTVNTTLKQGLNPKHPLPVVEVALQKSEAVEGKVQEVSEKLAVVNQALENEVNDRHRLEQQLAVATENGATARHAAFHDPLTGLPNRALFNDRLQHGVAQALRYGRTLAVLFVDLDGFKGINDTYGHEAGDTLLRTIAARLGDSTRGDDTVSRYGGDEFLYVLTEVQTERDIVNIAEKIIEAIRVPCDIGSGEQSILAGVGGSVGIAMFPQHGTTADALIASADRAMYQAKRGKTGYAFAPQGGFPAGTGSVAPPSPASLSEGRQEP
jgi:diguanylate cyclase (GGDEF)-like protein